MRQKSIFVPISVSAAVFAAAIAAVVVTNNMVSVARNEREAAERTDAAKKKDLELQNSKERTEAASREVERVRNEAARQEKENLEKQEEIANKKDETAEKERETQRLATEESRLAEKAARERHDAEAKALAAEQEKTRRQQKKLDYELSMSNKVAIAAIKKAEAERSKKDAIEAESRALELKRIDFEKWAQDLWDRERDIAERERALQPDISIYDSSNITWVADGELEVIGETNRHRRAEKVLPENDPRLPKATRSLARLDRLRYEASTNRLSVSQAKLLGELERLRDAARSEGRVIDAQFYSKSIKSLYPEYSPEPKQ